MNVAINNGRIVVAAANYNLTFREDRPFVFVADASANLLVELFVLSSVHPLHAREDTVMAGEWDVEECAEEVVLTSRAEFGLGRKTV